MATRSRPIESLLASLQIGDARLLGDGPPALVESVDPAQAVFDALADPIDFPPLSKATVPGDRIAIAIEPGGPRAAALAAGAVRAAVASGAEPDQIQVVSVKAEAGGPPRDPRDQLDADLAAQVRWIVHDPANRDQLAYLAASRSNLPILVHRALFDADLVIPIGCARLESVFGYWGPGGAVFPHFSDAKTIEQFRAIDHCQSPTRMAHLRREAAEAAEQLGVFLAVQAIPNAAGEISQVMAGQSKTLAEWSDQECRAVWRRTVGRMASLVIATVVGDKGAQTWDNVARAIATAAKVVEPGGAIAIYSELAAPPGASLGRMARGLGRGGKRAERIHGGSPDGWAAFQLAKVLDEVSVYLASELAPDVVEAIGVAPIGDLVEIRRLAASHPTCIVLEGAQYAQVELEVDE